jgi:hypothetical protein
MTDAKDRIAEVNLDEGKSAALQWYIYRQHLF